MRTFCYFCTYAFLNLAPIYFLMHLLRETETTVCPALTGSYYMDYFYFLDFIENKHYRNERFTAYCQRRHMELYKEFEKIMQSKKREA